MLHYFDSNPKILYPSLNTKEFLLNKKITKKNQFLSLNRYERKKNVTLSLKAFKQFLKINKSKEKYYLIIAGGYDSLVRENINHY